MQNVTHGRNEAQPAKSNCSATDADALNKYYLELSLR